VQPLDGLAALVGDAEVLGLGQLELGLQERQLVPGEAAPPFGQRLSGLVLVASGHSHERCEARLFDER
jgi:hypothetical protein